MIFIHALIDTSVKAIMPISHVLTSGDVLSRAEDVRSAEYPVVVGDGFGVFAELAEEL